MHIHHAADHLAAAKLLNELAGTVDRRLRIVRIKPLFKLARRVRAQSDALCRLADVRAVESRRLKEHGCHAVRNHGIFAAHDSGDTYFFLRVADHQHVRIQIPVLSVQRAENVAVLRPADDNLMPRDGVQVKGVHGLAVLLHHIVGNVHQIVDGADTACRKASLHPLRRGRDLNVFAHSRAVSRAELLILHLHGYIVLHLLVVSLCCHCRQHKRLSERSRRLSGNADHTVTVYTV